MNDCAERDALVAEFETALDQYAAQEITATTDPSQIAQRAEIFFVLIYAYFSEPLSAPVQ